jgi:hypothetical protein
VLVSWPVVCGALNAPGTSNTVLPGFHAERCLQHHLLPLLVYSYNPSFSRLEGPANDFLLVSLRDSACSFLSLFLVNERTKCR